MTQKIPMATATLLAGIPEFIGSELGDKALRKAYADAGLRNGLQATAGVYVAEFSLVAMMASAARQAGDDTLGALFGGHVNLGVYDTWGAYILEADTLAGSLLRFADVMRYVASHSTMSLTVTDDLAWLNYRWAVRTATGYRQICYASAGSLVNTLRHYLGPGFMPAEIHLDISRPNTSAHVEDHLPTRIVYGAEHIALGFPRHLLDTERPKPVSGTALTLSDVRRNVLSTPPRRIDAVVEEIVRLQIVNGAPSLEQTAQSLGMTVRTLHRELDRRGEGFRDLSKRVRMGMAKELLRETGMSVRAVSETVGYSDPYNFSRAFLRQFGVRPSGVRGSI